MNSIRLTPAFQGRRTYSLAPARRGDRLNVHTLGFYCRGIRTFAFENGGGLAPDYFLQFFHDPVRLECGGRERRVRAGSLVIVEPGQAMAYGRRDRAWANSYIRVSGSLVAALWKAHGFRHGQVHPLADAASFLRHLESIRLEMDRPGETQALVLEGLFGALCGEVLRPLSPPLALEAPQDSALERIHKKIQASFREKLEMRALASESGMAEVDFCRAFRKAYGMPPRRYAIELRLRHAAELLARAETAVRHVATACGYDDPFHFSKAFKHRFGVSPTLFRARADGAGEGAIRIRPGDLL